jgi:hypothetical protein
MTRRKIENFGTSKYKNKKLLSSQEERRIPPFSPLVKLHTILLKTHKMTRRKIEDSKTSK